MGVISYPIPPYSNVPIEPQFYSPNIFFIAGISYGVTTIVTTTEDHNFSVGQLVRLIIPEANQAYQLNQQSGIVLEIPASDQVTMTINSIGYQPFVTTTDSNQPQILPLGDVNSGATNSNGPLLENTFIPGSFINISPNF